MMFPQNTDQLPEIVEGVIVAAALGSWEMRNTTGG